MVQRTCIVDGCEKPRKRKSRMCSAHRHRLTRYGDPLGGPPPRPPAPVRTCEVDGCDRKHYAKGWCTRHYDRAFRRGSEDVTIHPHGWRTEVPSYETAHKRVRQVRGKAGDYPCVDCGERAHHWSYDHADPERLVQQRGKFIVAYSANPEHYEPRCHSCHVTFDQGREVRYRTEDVTGVEELRVS